VPKSGSLLLEVMWVFTRLGLTSFGGPIAHLGYFHDELIRRRQWMSEDEYADLVALAQFLPGPASSQVAMGLGHRRAGPMGAMAATVCFTWPSAMLLFMFALGLLPLATNFEWAQGLLAGLQLAAAVVVAHAIWQMQRQLCPDPHRKGLAIGAALLMGLGQFELASSLSSDLSSTYLRWLTPTILQFGVLLAAALIGVLQSSSSHSESPAASAPLRKGAQRWGATLLAIWVALLMMIPTLQQMAPESRNLKILDVFYRVGSSVFGGGHVVLPLLQTEVLQTHTHQAVGEPPRIETSASASHHRSSAAWLTASEFQAGYGAAQAIPGPLLSFAAYVGALARVPSSPDRLQALQQASYALIGVFLPSLLLILGAWPFWQSLKHWPRLGRAAQSLNAAVVGLLLASFLNPILPESIRNCGDVLALGFGLWLIFKMRWPNWAIVVTLGLIGSWRAL
jgi:chromate transporter